MKHYKVYLFDFDGTLFDTSKALGYVFKAAYGAVGINIEDSQVMYLSRIPLPVSYEELHAPKDAASWKKFLDVIAETINSDKSVELSDPYPETMEFFKHAKENNLTIGIVTSNNSKHVKDVLSYHKIPLDDVAVIIGNQEAPVPKPDPMPINVALKALGMENHKEDVVYIGDAKNDCLSAINAGIDYYFLDREEQGHYPDRAIADLMELFK